MNKKNIFEIDPALIFEVRQGIERECLRVDKKGKASDLPHPKSLGHKLTHKFITTDYAENLLEFITGVHANTNELLEELEDIHSVVTKSLGEEMLWCQSMPAMLGRDGDIPIAYYGESNVGKLKSLYRKGLGSRYGRSMQSIAGLHYNFSFSDSFWEHLKKLENSELSLMDFKNQKYFHLIRNYRRHSWLLVYLFGSTPTVDESFLKGKEHNLERLTSDTFFNPQGISLRMGGLGYTSAAQKDISICYNQLDTYIKTLEHARLTPYPAYTKIGLKNANGEYLQLNDHLLQIDNEFYSNIRPKNIARTRESALGALYYRGIEYIEVRLLDINPFEPLGVNKDQINFLHLFLSWCLSTPSEKISKAECDEIDFNYDQIVRFGRTKNLELRSQGEKTIKENLIQKRMEEISKFSQAIFDLDSDYKKSFEAQLKKVQSSDCLLANMTLEQSKKGFIQSTLENSSKAKEHFLSHTVGKKNDFEALAKASYEAEKKELAKDERSFEEFLAFYFDDIKLLV